MGDSDDDLRSVHSAASHEDDEHDDVGEGDSDGGNAEASGDEDGGCEPGMGGFLLSKAHTAWYRDDDDPGRQTVERRNSSSGRFDSGFKDGVNREPFKDPLGAFEAIFEPGLVDAIAARTTPHLEAKHFKPTSAAEITVYLALLMAKSLKTQPSHESYYNTKHFGEYALRSGRQDGFVLETCTLHHVM